MTVSIQWPSRSDEAVLCLTIDAEETNGTLRFRASYDPPQEDEEDDPVGRRLEVMGFTSRVGRYVFEVTKDGGRIVDAPSGTTQEERNRFAAKADIFLRQSWELLAEGYCLFPSEEELRRLAQGIAMLTVHGIIESNQSIDGLQFPSPDTIRVEGVCASCCVNPLSLILGELRGAVMGMVRIVIGRDGVVLGFLSHENPFADYFNGELAARVKKLLPEGFRDQVAVEVAGVRRMRALQEHMMAALFAAYGEPDPNAIEVRLRELDARDRGQQASSPAPESDGAIGQSNGQPDDSDEPTDDDPFGIDLDKGDDDDWAVVAGLRKKEE